MNIPSKDDAVIILSLERARLIALKKPTRKDMRMAFALDSAIKTMMIFRKFVDTHCDDSASQGQEGGANG
jgi:hypothetical protein